MVDRKTSKDIVAVILAISALVFVMLGVGRSYFPGLTPVSEGVLDVWTDIVIMISGGLIAYISRD